MTTSQRLAAALAALVALVGGGIYVSRPSRLPVRWPGSCQTHDSALVITEAVDSTKAVIVGGKSIEYIPMHGSAERMKLDSTQFLPIGVNIRLVAFCRDSLKLAPKLP